MKPNSRAAGYVVTTGNRLQSDGTFNYTYDNEGNVLTQTRISNGDVFEFTWDYRNRLTKIVLKNSGGTVLKEERFTYDVWNRRIGWWVDADGAGSGVAVQTWTVYDGANPYADFNGAGSLTNRYLSAPAVDQLFARVDASNNESWHLGDRTGSIRQIVNTSGTVLDALTYDSFGNLLTETTPANGDRFKFAVDELAATHNLLFTESGWYSPATGRYVDQASVLSDGNPYRYAGNNPTTDADDDSPGAAVGRAVTGMTRVVWGGVGWGLRTIGLVPPQEPVSPVFPGVEPRRPDETHQQYLHRLRPDLQSASVRASPAYGGPQMAGITPGVARFHDAKEGLIVTGITLGVAIATAVGGHYVGKFIGWGLGKLFGRATRVLTGQVHHAISKKIARALDDHPVLKGHYKPRDPRLTTQAVNKAAHNGYETWHRELDDEVINWIRDPKNLSATPKQFEDWLRWRYKQPDLAERFPNGL